MFNRKEKISHHKSHDHLPARPGYREDILDAEFDEVPTHGGSYADGTPALIPLNNSGKGPVSAKPLRTTSR